MRDQSVVIFGAGLAGMSAAYRLAQLGEQPVVIERDSAPGGLARSLQHGDFIVDMGRKEILDRVDRVLDFRQELLGDDYQKYVRRCGVLHCGRILETEHQFGGWRHGMSLPQVVLSAVDAAISIPRYRGRAKNFEQFRYGAHGRRLAQMFYQGYEEKLSCVPWSETPLPAQNGTNGTNGQDDDSTRQRRSFLSRLRKSGHHGRQWRHPRRGFGQFCEALAKRCVDGGAQILLNTSVTSVEADDSRVARVAVQSPEGETVFEPAHVISSLPLNFLGKLLDLDDESVPADPPAGIRRMTLLVYLFLNSPPNFPHSWLKITCPDVKACRASNFSTYSDGMVPPGRGCVCVEYVCTPQQPTAELSDDELAALAEDECVRNGLISRGSVDEHLVKRLRGADAASDLNDWWSPRRLALLERIKPLKNLYHVTIPGTDLATYSGLLAAEAIASNDRTTFDADSGPAMSARYHNK